MSLANIKAYVLTAATSGITDLMTALFDHFTAAPGLWRLKSGTSGTAAGFIIEPKAPVTESGFLFNLGISIRRNGTTNFQLALDPLNSYTGAGDAASGPTGGSVQASGDITLATTNIASTKIAVIETQDAMFALFFNAGLTNCPQLFHIGRCFDVMRESYRLAPLLNNGLAVLAGQFQQVTNGGLGTGTGGASRARHNGAWRPIDIVSGGVNNPIPDAPNADKETVVQWIANAYNAASSLPMRILVSRYMGIAANSRNTRTLIESATEDESWIHISEGFYTGSSANTVIIWEKGVSKPT